MCTCVMCVYICRHMEQPRSAHRDVFHVAQVKKRTGPSAHANMTSCVLMQRDRAPSVQPIHLNVSNMQIQA
jgi:hypothetical protein